MLCVPLLVQWLWLAARYRSLTLPSALNPQIETGGLAGESKSACLAQIGDAYASNVARWTQVAPGQDAVEQRLAAKLAYPLVVKPDIGWCGYGVRRVESDEELAAYAASFPADAAFIVQLFVAAPNEVGLFYVRLPGEATGRLTAMTLRHAPYLTGDGAHSLSTLAIRSGRSVAPGTDGTRVPASGERVPLTTVASMRVGARYEDASDRITPGLEARIDAIARSMPDFHVGRFDVRFHSLAMLQAQAFSIIEVNGAGSEAIQCWDERLSLHAAFAGVFAKQRMLFALGDRARALGRKPVGPVALAWAWIRQQRLISRYPPSN